MSPDVPLTSFYGPWFAALAATAVEKPASQGALVIQAAGLDLPVVQLVLAVAGVLMARPLAPRRDGERGLFRQVLVTAIMLVIASTWVIEARPGVLFTFVVAIGLGFSGYALIELAGKEIEGVIKRLFASVADAVANIGGPK